MGRDSQTFGVHQALLIKQPKFFRTALNGNWLESKTGIVELPEQSSGAFELYSGWLYWRKIPLENQRGEARENAQVEQLIHAYYLADMIEDVEFADAVIDKIIACIANRCHPPVIHTNDVYLSLPPGSPLRQLFVDIWIHESWNPWKYACEDLLPEIHKDIASGFVVGRQGDGKISLAPSNAPYVVGGDCHYHQHVRLDKPCYRTRWTWACETACMKSCHQS